MAVDYSRFQLTPDIAGALAGGIRQGAGIADLYRQKQERDKLEQIKAALSGQPTMQPQTEQESMLAAQSAELAGQSPQAEAEQAQPLLSQEDMIAKAKSIDPILAEQTLKAMGMDTASKRAEASRFAAQVQSLPPEMQNEQIMARANKLRSEGRDPSDTLQLLDMSPAERSVALQGVQMLDLSTKERLSLQAKQAGLAGKATKVQSSEILPDGTTIQVMGDGSTRVTDSSGNVLSGEARGAAIKKANSYGINIQQQRAQGRKVGEFTSKMANELYTRVDAMNANNGNLKQLIAEVRAGGQSGPLISKLPSLTSASQRLDNIKNRLGLDVVGSVTFGALSEKELKLAQETAVPNLPEPELIKWAEEKIAANEKLASYLNEQASFLEKPGNTRGMWTEVVKKRKAEREAAAKQAPGSQNNQTGQIKFLGFE